MREKITHVRSYELIEATSIEGLSKELQEKIKRYVTFLGELVTLKELETKGNIEITWIPDPIITPKTQEARKTLEKIGIISTIDYDAEDFEEEEIQELIEDGNIIFKEGEKTIIVF